MTDPVTDVATKALTKVASGGKNALGSILSAPLDLLKGAITSPFAAIGNMGKGIWNRTIGNPLSVLATSGVIALVAKFIPDVIRWFPMNINGKPVGETMAEHARDGGFPAVLKDSLLAGVAVNAAIGGLTGAVGGSVGNASGDKSAAEKTGNVLGAIATLGGIGYLAYKAVNREKIEYNPHEDADPKIPPVTPPVPAHPAKDNAPVKQ